MTQTNKNVEMKDEHKGIPINKFVGLKSKMYSILSENNKESNTAKEVNVSIEFNEYKGILLNKKNNQTQNEKNSK